MLQPADYAVCTAHKASLLNLKQNSPYHVFPCLALLRDTLCLSYLVWMGPKILRQTQMCVTRSGPRDARLPQQIGLMYRGRKEERGGGRDGEGEASEDVSQQREVILELPQPGGALPPDAPAFGPGSNHSPCEDKHHVCFDQPCCTALLSWQAKQRVGEHGRQQSLSLCVEREWSSLSVFSISK